MGLTIFERNALNEFAFKHGRFWKSKLRQKWADGFDYGEKDADILQRIRNKNTDVLTRFKRGEMIGCIECLPKRCSSCNGMDKYQEQGVNKYDI